MIDFTNLRVITGKELRDALRNRWFLIFTVAFAGLALALSVLGRPTGTQFSTYSRTTASLINLVLLFVPLIGLTLGASNLVGDRETGVLQYLLSTPVNRVEVLLGKYLALVIALFTTLSLGFGLSGIVLALNGQTQDAGGYFLMVILAAILSAGMLSLGFLVSVAARKTSSALGAALFIWLFLVFIGDLGVMGTAMITQMPIQTVFFTAALNPLQLFKMSSIMTIQANLEILGPAGIYAQRQFGDALLPLLVIALVLWGLLPLAGALFFFTRQEMVKGTTK